MPISSFNILLIDQRLAFGTVCILQLKQPASCSLPVGRTVNSFYFAEGCKSRPAIATKDVLKLQDMAKDYYDPDTIISRRNERLERFFALFYENTDTNFRIIGDKNCPAVIVDETWCISCFVKNFELNFTDKPSQGQIIATVKLQKDQTVDLEYIASVIASSEHRPVFKLRYANSDLYLAGYNFINKNDLTGKYPVFAREHPKIYFNREYAQQIADSLSSYNLSVC